jgi:RNA polymerase sigma-70 factor (ECF subfamily)
MALRIAHNLCVDHFRKVKRTPTITTSDDRDIFEVINVMEAGADNGMIQDKHMTVYVVYWTCCPKNKEK